MDGLRKKEADDVTEFPNSGREIGTIG